MKPEKILATLLLLVAAPLWAQEPKPNLVIVGTRTERDPYELPYTINEIDLTEEIMHKMPRTMPEVFRDVPGVMVQKTGHGQGSPYIRGFTGYRTLFLIDGIRLNNSVWRDGPNQYTNTVDIYSIENVQLLKGPSSTLYGSDALGGTSNAVTRGPADDGWDTLLYYRHASAEDSNTGRAQLSGTWNDHWGMIAGFTAKDFGDLEGGSEVGTQPMTGYREYDWDAKLVYSPDDRQRLTLAHYGVRLDDAWRTHRTIFGVPWQGTTVGDEKKRALDQARNLTYLRYDRDVDSGWVDNIQATLSYHRQEEERERIRADDRWDVQGFDVSTIGAGLQFQKALNRQQWTYGIEYYHDDVDSFRTFVLADLVTVVEGIQGPVADDAEYRTLGIYAEDEVELTNSLGLIAGLRYNYMSADAQNVADPMTGQRIEVNDDWDKLVGNLRLRAWLETEHEWQAFLGISQGFRAPNLSDLTRFDSARSNEIETPSPGLDSEEVVSYETGIKFLDEKTALQLSLYYMDIDNLIVRTPTGRIIDGEFEITKKNGGNGYVTGVEFSGSFYPTENWEIWSTATWMDSEIETFPTSDPIPVREPIDRQMPTTINGGLKWLASDSRLWIEGFSTWADDADNLSTRDMNDTQRIPPGGTPGYLVFGVRAGWRMADIFSVSFAVENISDEDYRVHGSGLNGPGRNFVLALETIF
jgi:hemoglobin/transferrin/lactoferrin receptor protein